MDIRNAKYNEHGTIDCEIEHPVHGWIPFTADPDDSEQHGKDIHAALVEAGGIDAYVAPVKSPEEVAEELATQYIRDRAAAHLPIQDQLDMLYWDKANGTELWRDYVAEIKTRIPKPV